MDLYKKWITEAYDREGHSIKAVWDVYMPLEQKIYENMLESKDGSIYGTVKELGERYNMPAHYICGFLDGIKGALDVEPDVENLEEDTPVNVTADFEKLFKKMVEYKAEHLYTLPQWNGIYTEEQRKALYTEQKSSTTFVRTEEKVGRNEPCPCGSGKKYKRCCAS